MPQYIVKVDPTRDLYFYWSTIVEAPIFLGTRTELAEELLDRAVTEIRKEIDDRFTRADTTGTSGHPPFDDGSYTDDGLTYHQQGRLPRRNFAAYADLLLTDDNAPPGDLLEPFDDLTPGKG